MRKILQTENKTLQSLIDKAKQLESLNQKVLAVLPDELKPHCKVANFAHGILTLTVHSAAWGMKLRFAHSDLLRRLRSDAGLYTLKSIKQLVRPFSPAPEQRSSKLAMESAASAESLTQSAATISDPDLKQALEKLALDVRINAQHE